MPENQEKLEEAEVRKELAGSKFKIKKPQSIQFPIMHQKNGIK